MDRELREMMRRNNIEPVSAEELVARRSRAGLCVLCARETDNECPCFARYLYKDKDNSFRLRRDQRSTLPCGMVTGINSRDLTLRVLMFLGPDGKTIKREDTVIKFAGVVDWDTAVLGGIDVGEKEKRVLREYLSALDTNDFGLGPKPSTFFPSSGPEDKIKIEEKED